MPLSDDASQQSMDADGLIQSPRSALIAFSLILMFVAGVFLGALAGRGAARHQRVVVLTCVTFTLAISGVLVICGLPFMSPCVRRGYPDKDLSIDPGAGHVERPAPRSQGNAFERSFAL